MSDKLIKLKPRPFCGCTEVPKRQGNGIGDYWLECFECGASTRLREDGAGNEKDWNRRASPAPAISESEDARDAGRYRWLRNYPNNVNSAVYGPTGGLLRRDEYLDAAIDAARKGEKS